MNGLLSAGIQSLLDLLYPRACFGCAYLAEGYRATPVSGVGLCERCLGQVRVAPFLVRAAHFGANGGPPAMAALRYYGAVRSALLAYKEHQAHRLAPLFGRVLAEAILIARATCAPWLATPLVIVPIPASGSARRRRAGDHVLRIAWHAIHRLRMGGMRLRLWCPLRARDGRPDSVGLSAAKRRANISGAFVLRHRGGASPGWRSPWCGQGDETSGGKPSFVLLDDVVASGATLSEATLLLRTVEIEVSGAVTLAAPLRE